MFGRTLYNLCRGIDDRPVRTHSERKSVSVEDTFLHDLPSLAVCQGEIKRLFDSLKARHEKAQKKQNIVIKALYVKIRFNDFKSTTAQKIHQKLNINVFHDLIKTAWHRKSRPVRLLGLGIQYQKAADIEQIDLDF